MVSAFSVGGKTSLLNSGEMPVPSYRGFRCDFSTVQCFPCLLILDLTHKPCVNVVLWRMIYGMNEMPRTMEVANVIR